MKQQAALLKDPAKPVKYKIEIVLQENKTAKFEYTDRFLAREHYDQLRGVGVIAGHAIKRIEFFELYGR